MVILIAALIVAAAVAAAGMWISGELKRGRADAQRARELKLSALFAPAVAAVQHDPRVILAWQPLVTTLRARFAGEFAALDAASGSTFPFSKDVVASAHARWTTEWLTWEKAHDVTYKLKALEAQQEPSGADPALGRARLDAVEREKLELYQRRYEEYVRVGKALQALIG